MTHFLLARLTTSICAIALLAGLRDRVTLTSAAILLAAIFIHVRGLKAFRLLVLATLAMAVPLMLVHGIINPTFAGVDLDAPITWRPDGFAYAQRISLQMWLLFVVGAIWMGLPRRLAFSLIASSRIPPVVGIGALQALVMIEVLERKIECIRTAQKSRGIPIEGRLVDRVRSLAAVSVPLIAATLLDANARGELLTQRGLGTAKLVALDAIPRPNLGDYMSSASLAIASVALVCAEFHVS